MAAELAAQARAFQEGADQFLQESGLLNLLHQVGEVRITGAYAYGVMLDPDIDIELVVSPSKTGGSLARRVDEPGSSASCWSARSLQRSARRGHPRQHG